MSRIKEFGSLLKNNAAFIAFRKKMDKIKNNPKFIAFCKKVDKFLAFLKKYTMVIALAVVVGFFFFKTDGLILLPQNINNLISQNAYVFVLAAGMLLCILTGGNIDLACGSVACFLGGVGAIIMDKDISCWVAVALMLIGGLLVGAWQGFWIAYIKVPPFIATLAGMYAFRGLSNVVMNGFAVAVNDKIFLKVFGGGDECYVPDINPETTLNETCIIGGIIVILLYLILSITSWVKANKKNATTEKIYSVIIRGVIISVLVGWIFYKLANYRGIPTSLIWIALVLVVYGYITANTRVGRYLYSVGGNEKATKLSGVDPRKTYMFAYINMGLMSGLAGILMIARQVGAQPTYGQGYEMDAIAACFIGGASAYGGEGKVFGIIIGAVLMGVINQGMSIMGISSNYQKVVKGIVLLLAIIFDVLSNRKKK